MTQSQLLAIKIVNLRRALRVANKMLVEDGKFGIHCGEDDGPSFRDGRTFWKQVRELTKEE